MMRDISHDSKFKHQSESFDNSRRSNHNTVQLQKSRGRVSKSKVFIQKTEVTFVVFQKKKSYFRLVTKSLKRRRTCVYLETETI